MSIQERALRYGEGGRGFAMLTLPDRLDDAPIVVFLNAGLLHRSEPYRLNVLAARRLAELGYLCARIDLSGKGETPAREGLTNRDSVALDWNHLCEALERHFGRRPMVVMGLCSGADNGIKLAAIDERIRGLILLDARSPKDRMFVYRQVMSRAGRWRQWMRLPAVILRHLGRRLGDAEAGDPDLNLRDLPRADDLRACLTSLVRNDGRLLMLFTHEERHFYNEQGQFGRAAGVPGLERICTERFWPDVLHIYPVAAHRRRLLSTLETWAQANLPQFRDSFKTVRV
jgi:pimeloyl-ACP methyl ester carboxylesterase